MKRCIMKYRKPVNKIIYGRSSIGGRRMLNMLTGEQLPRICWSFNKPLNFYQLLFKFARLLLIALFIINLNSCFNSDKKSIDNTTRSSGFSIKGVSMVAPQNIINSMALKPIVDINTNSISLMPYAFCSIENPEVKYNQHGQHWGENTDGVIATNRFLPGYVFVRRILP